MLEKEFQYYIEHQKELVEQYNGKYLVIVGEEVVGVYESEPEAYFEAQKKYETGSFLVQLCEPGEGSFTQIFHSRVAF